MLTTEDLLKLLKTLSLPSSDQKLEDNKISIFLNCVPEYKHPELAELLVDYTQANNVLLPFITNAVYLEVEQTKHESVLFREDCFAVKAINRVLFSDLGKRYLSKVIVPLCTSIVNTGATLDISLEIKKNSSEQFELNLKKSIELLNSFFELFAKSASFSPVLFREIFSYIQQMVDRKFGSSNTTPYVLDFIFFKFICPAIINPLKYGLLGEMADKMTPTTFRAFVNFSKLLNNVSHGLHEKYEGPEYKDLQRLIIKLHPILLTNLATLVDPIEIKKMKEILDSNHIDESWSAEEQKEIEVKLCGFLYPLLRRASVSSDGSTEGVDLMESKVAAWMSKLNDSPWKTEAFKNRTYQICKIGNLSFACFMTKTEISSPLLKVYEFIKTPHNMKHLIGDGYAGVDMRLQVPHYDEHCTKMNYPFPFSPRAYYTSQWDCFLSDKRAIIIQDQMPERSQDEMPRLKGFVETRMELSGWLLEADEKDEKTTITWILHTDAGGSLPSWFQRGIVAGAFMQLDLTKNFIEQNM